MFEWEYIWTTAFSSSIKQKSIHLCGIYSFFFSKHSMTVEHRKSISICYNHEFSGNPLATESEFYIVTNIERWEENNNNNKEHIPRASKTKHYELNLIYLVGLLLWSWACFKNINASSSTHKSPWLIKNLEVWHCVYGLGIPCVKNLFELFWKMKMHCVYEWARTKVSG